MKHKIFFGALCATAAFFASCNDEDIVKFPHAVGDEIVFGARAGFENADNSSSRTVYSGETYSASGKTFERIDWVNTDIIQIYSPEVSAPNDKTVDYKISGSISTSSNKQNSYSTLIQHETEVTGLQWGDDVTHNFYALYPSPVMFPSDEETSLKQGVKMNGTIAEGFVPVKQNGIVPSTPNENNTYVIKPNMTYAYMVAKSTVGVNERENGVNMTFHPLVTAVEITLTNPADNITKIQLQEVLLKSTQEITGAFQCDLQDWTGGDFNITTPEGGFRGNNIILSTNIKSGEGNSATFEPMTLLPGQSVRVTAFLLPGVDIENLSVGFQTPKGMSNKLLTNISIPKNTKYIINGLTLPKTEIDYSKWMSFLPDEMPLKDLSIPGTGGTFSYNYNKANAELYKAQIIDFEDQWKAGIRAFEIISDRKSSKNNSLESQEVQCNGADMGVEVGDVFRNLLDKLNPKDDKGDFLVDVNENRIRSTETAVVMLTYQPTGGGDERNPDTYVRNLVLLYRQLAIEYGSDSFISFDPNLKLSDARGKLMILVRATQHVEDNPHDFDELLSETKIIEIDGCGTAKDRWGCRGYEVKVGPNDSDWKTALDIQASGYDNYDTDDRTDANNDGYYDYPMVENYMYAELETKATNATAVPWNSIGFDSHVRKNNMNFAYETNLKSNGTYIKIWCQEWQRVVPALYDVNGNGEKDGLPVYLGSCKGKYSSNNPHYFYVFWHDSYKEKEEAIKKTFDMAISGTYENEYLFINSLCGYFVTDPSAGGVKNTSYIPYADDPCVEYDDNGYLQRHSWNTSDISFPPAVWSPYWPIGGMEGDIAGLAKELNNMLYNHILSKSDIDFTGPTGIVYMNRVTNIEDNNDLGSYYLPSAIIANNFKHN